MVLHRARKARTRRLTQRISSSPVNLSQGFVLDLHGWLKPHPALVCAPSPNFDTRPANQDTRLLVLHNISLPPGVFGGSHIIDFFQNELDCSAHPWLARLKDLRVSAHFLIRRTGQVVQFVATEHRAWHAGVSEFQGHDRCNDFSIGIELEGTDTLSYEPTQYQALKLLCSCLRDRYPITAVRGHEHIAPGRKTDPGLSFDWDRFCHEGRWLRRQLPSSS